MEQVFCNASGICYCQFQRFSFVVTTKTTAIIYYTKDTFLVLLKGPFVFFSLCISCLLKQGRRLTVPILDALSRLDLDAELLVEVRAFTEHFRRPQPLLSSMRAGTVSSFQVLCYSCGPSKVLGS